MKFYILQTLPPTDRVIEIIKAVGNTWPFLLTVTAIVFLVAYKKNIGRFFSKFDKVSGKTSMIELNLESSNTKEQVKQTEPIQITDSPTIEEITNEETIEIRNPSFYDVYLKLKNKELKEADILFQEIQNKEADLIEKEWNEYIFLRLKYYSNIDTLFELEERVNNANNNRLKFLGYREIAGIYYSAKKYSKSLDNYKISYSFTKSDSDKVELAEEIAKCLIGIHGKQSAIDYLKNVKDEIINEKCKSKIFKLLSNQYNEENEWLLKCLSLEMAHYYDPNNSDLLFDLGYSYSNKYNETDDKIVTLALLHYDQLVKNDSKSEVGFNNLAVAYSNLNIKGKSIINYKKSIELGNSLAASNLSNIYIHQGFYSEAKEILNKVRGNENVDENVWASLKEMAKKENEENEITEKTIQRAFEEQAFLKKFALTYFSQKCDLIDFEGEWKCSAELVQFKKSANNMFYEISWAIDNKNFSITLPLENNLSLFGTGTYYPKGGGMTYKLIVFAIINNDFKQIDVLLFDKWELKSYNYSITR